MVVDMVLSNYTFDADNVIIAIAILSPIWFMFQMNIFSIIVVVTRAHKLALIGVLLRGYLPLNSANTR
jgi:hypothetical protein